MSGSTQANNRVVLLAGAMIVLATVAAYHGIFSVPFIFDDFNAVTLNPTIRHLWPPWDILRTPQGSGSGADGRPLANLTFALNYAVSGTDAWSYHGFSLIVHTLAALTLFGVLRRTMLRQSEKRKAESGDSKSDAITNPTVTAFLIALIWAVHPLQTESVTTVVHRTELLVSLFYLLTLYCFVRSTAASRLRSRQASAPGADVLGEVEGRPSNSWATLCIASCFFGMLSKEVMVSAPLIVLLYDRTFLAGTFKEAWRRRRTVYLGLAGTWAALALLRILTPQRGSTGGFGLGISPWAYALTQFRAIIHYLRLSFWPHPLILDYGHGVAGSVSEILPQGLLLILLLAGTALALWRRPPLGFAGACFFAILGPSSSFVPLITQTIAEHRMYLPLAAVIAVAVCAMEAAGAATGRKFLSQAHLVVLPLVAGLFVFLTAERNHDYRSAVAIWTDTVSKVPDNPRAHNNLANAYLELNRTPEAIAEYEAALKINPDDAQSHYNLGGALLQSGRVFEAIDHYEAAVRSAPSFVRAHDNLGAALLKVGRRAEALEQFAEAVQADPDHAEARYNLANALAQSGRLDDAITQYQAAVRLAPELTDAHFNLAQALAASGRSREAIAQYEIVLILNPADAEARSNLEQLEKAKGSGLGN